MRSNELRKLTKSIIENAVADYNIKQIYYKIANDEAVFPHIVFDIDAYSQSSDDLNRFNYVVYIDIYDKKTSKYSIEEIADRIVDKFNFNNNPQSTILPAYFFESMNELIDEDKTLNHYQIQLQVQLFERN